jgi:hypothetical protein
LAAGQRGARDELAPEYCAEAAILDADRLVKHIENIKLPVFSDISLRAGIQSEI